MIGIMLDFETMGIGIRPAITEIGAVAFRDDFSVVDNFHEGVTLGSSIVAGLDIKMSTVKFWQGQNEAAKESFKDSQFAADHLESTLNFFMSWINDMRAADEEGDIRLWGNGMISDNVWLLSACDAVGIDLFDHVSYTEHACYRQEMARCLKKHKWNPHWELPFKGVKHNPIDDCKHQINALQAYNMLETAICEIRSDTIKRILNHFS